MLTLKELRHMIFTSKSLLEHLEIQKIARSWRKNAKLSKRDILVLYNIEWLNNKAILKYSIFQ